MDLKKKEPSGKRKNKISETGDGAISIGTDTDTHFFYTPHINLFQCFMIILDINYKPYAGKFQWQREKKGIKKIYNIKITRRKRSDE